MASDWRLGEELWRGPWHQACCRAAAPWRGRKDYGALCLGPAGPTFSPTLLVLGGLDEEAGPLNDVWRSDDEGQSWEVASPHDAGRRGEGGSLILRKWIGRSGFASAASWSYKGGRLSALVYVVGGHGPKRPLADVWVSQDLGRSFVRMCGDAPFGARSDASLAVCPGAPERLILSGGMAGLDTYKKVAGSVRPLDCWVSLDAGESWAEVGAPEVPLRTSPKLHFAGAESLLLLGGSSISMVGQALVVSRQPAPDAFAARVDWEARQLRWRPAELLDGGGGELLGQPPLCAGLVAGALRSRQLVACGGDALIEEPQPGKDVAGQGADGGRWGAAPSASSASSSATARAPEGARLALAEPLMRQMGELQHLLLPAGGLSLLLLSSSGAWTTRPPRAAPGEQRPARGPAPGLRRQVAFVNWLGAKFERRGLPCDVWSKVVAGVFHPRALASPGLLAQRFQWHAARERVVRELGDTVRICVLGSADACGAGLELAAAVAAYLDAGLDAAVAFVTGGAAGIQRAFAEGCGDGSQVFNLLPMGGASGYDSGRDVHAGADAAQCREVLARLGDICIVFEGGADVAEAAQSAAEAGALLLPLAGPGGAAGQPPAAPERPPGVREEAWALLRDPCGAARERAEAAVEVAARFVLLRETAAQATARLCSWFGNTLRVCILATEEPLDEEAADYLDLARALAAELDKRVDQNVSFITLGATAVERIFAESCAGATRFYSLLPAGQATTCGPRRELRAGAELAQCREVFGRLGDVYVGLAGGPGAAKAARCAAERGARVVPVVRSGGAAAGRFGFPKEALRRPAGVAEGCWSLLSSTSAPAADVAAAAAAVVATAAAAATAEQAARLDALRRAEQQAEEEARRRAREEAERRAEEEAERRRWEDEQRRAREEKAAVHVTIVTSRGRPCGVVQAAPDDRIARLRELAQATSPVLNGARFHLMSYTVSLTDDMTLTQAGLRNGSLVTACFL